MKDFVNILHFCLLPICASNIQLFLPGKILTACSGIAFHPLSRALVRY